MNAPSPKSDCWKAARVWACLVILAAMLVAGVVGFVRVGPNVGRPPVATEEVQIVMDEVEMRHLMITTCVAGNQELLPTVDPNGPLGGWWSWREAVPFQPCPVNPLARLESETRDARRLQTLRSDIMQILEKSSFLDEVRLRADERDVVVTQRGLKPELPEAAP